jgi:hypothetical protein
MLTRLGFTCSGRGENFDSLGREERKWVVQLFVLETDGECPYKTKPRPHQK